MTKKQFEEKERQLKSLQDEVGEAKKQMAEATAHGGAFEFKIPEVYTLTEQINLLNSRIAKLKQKLQSAELVDEGGMQSEIVSLFSCIHVVDQQTNKKNWFCFEKSEIMEAQMISQESPIGKALLGRKVGDMIQVDVPKGKKDLKIIEIR